MTEKIIVFLVSGLIFQIFINIMVWMNKRKSNSVMVTRTMARIAAYCFCSLFTVVGLAVSQTRDDIISVVAPLISVLLCNITVLLLNKYLADNSIGSELIYFIDGLILAMAILFITANAWSVVASLLVQFAEGYIGYDFRNQIEQEEKQKKANNSFVKPLVHILLYSIGIWGVFYFFPDAEAYIVQHQKMVYCPWAVLAVIHAINYVRLMHKKKSRVRNKRKKRR